MRLSLAIAAAALLAASAAQAADTQLMCKAEALVMPAQSKVPVDLKLTVAGGIEGPSGVTYAWSRPEAVPLELKGLLGDTLKFHGMTTDKTGGVLVADADLNRNTLALKLKVKRVGGQGDEAVNVEGACSPG